MSTTTAPTREASTLHPFLEAGMGEGPYAFVGCFDLAAAMTPDSAANFGNMTGWVKDAPRLKAGMGTCACCGHGIMQICIIRTGNGDLYGVGSDCVLKTEHEGIARKGVEAALAARRKAMNAKRAAAKRKAAWEAGRAAREARELEWAVRQLAEFKDRRLRAIANAPVISFFYGEEANSLPGTRQPEGEGWGSEVWLDEQNEWRAFGFNGGFRASILADFLNGSNPATLSPRAQHILADIKAKNKGGRAGSKAYEAVYQQARDILSGAQAGA